MRDERFVIITVHNEIDVGNQKCVAHLGDIKIKARRIGNMSQARFRHKNKRGDPRSYPDGLEKAIGLWLHGWGYAGLSLDAYLNKLFHKAHRSTIDGTR
jgi:hypothetical protein